MDPLISSLLIALVAITLLRVFGLLLYRLFLHPLKKVPGPILAAATWWYTTYYEVFQDGAMVEHLAVLHKKYGPVVRIGPNELHFSDFGAYGDIYVQGTRFFKDPKLYNASYREETSFSALDPRRAKVRKDIMSPLFSRRAILKLEGFVQKNVATLISRLLSYESFGKPVNMHRAYRSMTMDVIISYCFARDYNILDAHDFQHPLILAYETTFPMCLIAKNFHSAFTVFLAILRVFAHFKPESPMIRARRTMAAQIDELIAHPDVLQNQEHETIYHHLLTPHPEKGQFQIPSRNSLLEEAVNLLAAGSDTVGNACTVGTFHILNDSEIHGKLVAELTQAWPDKEMPMLLESLERLPYLTAVIKESLRLSHGVVAPAPRIVGPTDAMIGGRSIPAGTVVSMGSTFVHHNPDIFPDPYRFSPDRWLQETSRELETYLVAFSKGPRSCLGINLAWCEMYLIFGHVFRKVDMIIHDTTITDLAFRSHLTPTYRGKMLHCCVKQRSS